MAETETAKGLGGWLILIGLGVALAPIRLLTTLTTVYKPLFDDGTWQLLTTAGSEDYIPHFGTLLIAEITFNSLMLLASIYLVYLFFTKHYLFPRVFIGLALATLVFIPLDAWCVTRLFPEQPMFDQQTTGELVKTIITAVIWIPYMLVSKRVKATFVGKCPSRTHAPATGRANDPA